MPFCVISLTQLFSKVLLQFASATTQSGLSLFWEVGGTEPPSPCHSRGALLAQAGLEPLWALRIAPAELPLSPPSSRYPLSTEQGNGHGQDTAPAPVAPASPFISPGRIHYRWAIFCGIRLISSMEIAYPVEISSQGMGRGRTGGPWPWISELGAQRSCKEQEFHVAASEESPGLCL